MQQDVKMARSNIVNKVRYKHAQLSKKLVSTFLIATGFFFSGTVKAADEPLQLATRAHLPPYVYHDASSGIEVDLIKAIFDEMDVDIQFVQMPRVRMIQSFDLGQMDGILTQNTSVSDIGCATDWYLKHQNVAFTLADTNIELNSLEDLSTIPVLSFDGATKYLGVAYRNAMLLNPEYRESTNQQSHIELLYLKRFKVIIGDEWILRLAQRNHFDSTGAYQKLTAHYVMPASLYSARFRDEKVCKAFNKSLAKLRGTGRYDQIVTNYHQKIMMAGTAIGAMN